MKLSMSQNETPTSLCYSIWQLCRSKIVGASRDIRFIRRLRSGQMKLLVHFGKLPRDGRTKNLRSAVRRNWGACNPQLHQCCGDYAYCPCPNPRARLARVASSPVCGGKGENTGMINCFLYTDPPFPKCAPPLPAPRRAPRLRNSASELGNLVRVSEVIPEWNEPPHRRPSRCYISRSLSVMLMSFVARKEKEERERERERERPERRLVSHNGTTSAVHCLLCQSWVASLLEFQAIAAEGCALFK